MNRNEIDRRLDEVTNLINQIRFAEEVLDELFFSRPTLSIAPPPVNFFHSYTESAFQSVAAAKAEYSKANSDSSTSFPANADATTIEYPDNFGELIGQRIREIRSAKGLTQNDLAVATEIRRPNIARLERGHSLPNLATLLRVSSALQTPIYDFLAPLNKM